MKESFENILLGTCIGWICLYTFNPDFIKIKKEWEFYPSKNAYPDTLKCLIFAFLGSILIASLLYIKNKQWY